MLSDEIFLVYRCWWYVVVHEIQNIQQKLWLKWCRVECYLTWTQMMVYYCTTICVSLHTYDNAEQQHWQQPQSMVSPQWWVYVQYLGHCSVLMMKHRGAKPLKWWQGHEIWHPLHTFSAVWPQALEEYKTNNGHKDSLAYVCEDMSITDMITKVLDITWLVWRRKLDSVGLYEME
jgi:hypothetical protein